MTKQQKAAKTRAKNKADRIWTEVRASIKRTGCRCDIRKGMTYDQLRKLNGGCTDYHGHQGGRWVCPTLDLYRRLVGYPQDEAA